MCLFHLQLLRQIFCGANTDNGFPVHQGTASLQNNNVHATTGLALGQCQLPDFIPNVHIMLATLLSFGCFLYLLQFRFQCCRRDRWISITSIYSLCLTTENLTAWAERRKKINPNMLPCNTFVPVNGKTKLPEFLQSPTTALQLYAEIHTLLLKPTLLPLSYLVWPKFIASVMLWNMAMGFKSEFSLH